MGKVRTVLGIIGGSGVYKMEGLELIREHNVKTPYGSPSDVVMEVAFKSPDTGETGTAYFIPRHGRGHVLTPSEVPYRANIYALKTLGVTHLLAVSAVGIMRESIKPGDMVIPDQIFDRTKGTRDSTFFGGGIVGHVPFADPFSGEMRDIIEKSARKVTDRLHLGGAYVCMEGPQFSTRSESLFYRETLKPSVIGMTGIPEAKLAREAEMCYGMLALATDYDCWHDEEDDVSVDAVLKVMQENASTANDIVKNLVVDFPAESSSPDLEAAKFAILTDRAKIPAEKIEELGPLYGKYLKP